MKFLRGGKEKGRTLGRKDDDGGEIEEELAIVRI